MRNKILLTALLVAISAPAFAAAEDASSTRGVPPIRKEFRDDRRDIVREAREDRKDLIEDRKALGTTTRERREDFRDGLREIREEKIEALKENREEMKSALEDRKKELMEKREGRKDERKTKLAEKSKEIVKKALERIFNHLNTRIEKLVSVDTKIAAKLSDLQATGVNTSTSVTLYTAAQLNLTKAKTDVEAAKVVALEQTATSTSKEVIRSLVKTAEDSIKTAGESYRAVLKDIKVISPTASTTTSI